MRAAASLQPAMLTEDSVAALAAAGSAVARHGKPSSKRLVSGHLLGPLQWRWRRIIWGEVMAAAGKVWMVHVKKVNQIWRYHTLTITV